MSDPGDAKPRHPHAHEPTGSEPVEAKSAYRLRFAFAVVGLVVGVAAAIVFGSLIADEGTPAVWGLVVGVLVAVSAALDIVILRRRRWTQ